MNAQNVLLLNTL